MIALRKDSVRYTPDRSVEHKPLLRSIPMMTLPMQSRPVLRNATHGPIFGQIGASTLCYADCVEKCRQNLQGAARSMCEGLCRQVCGSA